MGFTIADNRIWIRCFQISETELSKADLANAPGGDVEAVAEGAAKVVGTGKRGDRETKLALVEMGPRFVLTPIVILEGSFGGPVIYENKEFVSPNQVRAELRLGKAGRYRRRSDQGLESKERRDELGLRTGGRRKERDELDSGVLFK